MWRGSLHATSILKKKKKKNLAKSDAGTPCRITQLKEGSNRIYLSKKLQFNQQIAANHSPSWVPKNPFSHKSAPLSVKS
jgi:hypothetical protein